MAVVANRIRPSAKVHSNISAPPPAAAGGLVVAEHGDLELPGVDGRERRLAGSDERSVAYGGAYPSSVEHGTVETSVPTHHGPSAGDGDVVAARNAGAGSSSNVRSSEVRSTTFRLVPSGL